jgi:hypothetical protein
MKRLKVFPPSTTVAVLSAALSTAATVAIAPARAQTDVVSALRTQAEAACIDQARIKGFELSQVVDVTPVDADTVNVVLDLTRDGQLFKLTCGYTDPSLAATVDSGTTATTGVEATSAETAIETSPNTVETAETTETVETTETTADTAPIRTYRPWLNPWWGILLPLLVGLPLLLWWVAGRREERDRYAVADRNGVYHGDRSDAIVRAEHEVVNIHSGPGRTYPVTGALRNGEHTVLSGRYDSDWVELENGGWIPARSIETAARYY